MLVGFDLFHPALEFPVREFAVAGIDGMNLLPSITRTLDADGIRALGSVSHKALHALHHVIGSPLPFA